MPISSPRQLEDGRAFVGGAKPGAGDIHAYMNFWWIKAAIPHVAASLLKEYPAIDAWVARIAAIGHGTPSADGFEGRARHREGRNAAKRNRRPIPSIRAD